MICKKFKKTVAFTLKVLDDTLNNALTVAHSITNEVAKVIDNPLFELLVSQLPAGVNVDAVLSKVEDVLKTTGEITECQNLTGIEKVNCLMKGLNILPKDERNSKLLRLSSALTAMFDGERFEKVVYDTAAQNNYLNEVLATGKPLTANKTRSRPVSAIHAPVSEAIQALSQVHKGFAQPVNDVPQIAAGTPNAATLPINSADGKTLFAVTANPEELKQQPDLVSILQDGGKKANPFN